MNNTDTKTPSSFLALTVGIFIGAMFVLPMFAYMCRMNGQLRQENLRLRAQSVYQELHKRPPVCGNHPSLELLLDHYKKDLP